MKERYKEITYTNKDGITFNITSDTPFIIKERKTGKVIVRATAEYSGSYTNPPIPEGFTHLYGKWNNGFVIRRSSDGSEFVWIPVESLKPNGTLDGKSFTEKFGRRKYSRDTEFSKYEFHEELTKRLALQIKSVKKYGGFYISRYNISKNKKTGKPQSIKGEYPWRNISFEKAKKVATSFAGTSITSHLPFGAEYDTVLEWFIQSGARTHKEITEDSTKWGNFASKNHQEIIKTGSNKAYCTNRIYDIAGNVTEWTQEVCYVGNSWHVLRGDDFECIGHAASRLCLYDNGSYYAGFRVVLCIE